MIEVLRYTWNDFEDDVRTIQQRLQSYSRNLYIVGLHRGGLPLGVALSNRLVNTDLGILKFQTYGTKNDIEIEPLLLEPKKNDLIVIVDDIYDSGNTMDKAREYISSNYQNDIVCYTLFSTQPSDHYCNYMRSKNGLWIKFPWE